MLVLCQMTPCYETAKVRIILIFRMRVFEVLDLRDRGAFYHEVAGE